jgi:Phosphoribosylaminoimidazolesuccinocarboxamide (SAICAR) synthase
MSESATHLASGKVRELYALDDDKLLLVASDRISTFDVVLPTEIPDKGRVLTGLSGFWFTLLRGIVPNHMLAIREDGRSMECQKLEMLPDRVRRARLPCGLGWKDYQATGATSGHALPEGLQESDRLPEPIFTPATKAQIGDHDENITRDQAAELVGPGRFARRNASRSSCTRSPRARTRVRDHHRRHEVRARRRREGQPRARRRGADAGLVALLAGRHVPPGRSQDSFDKQFVATTARPSTGTRRLPAPSSRPRSLRTPARSTSRRSSG